MDELRLIEKLRRIEALYAGARGRGCEGAEPRCAEGAGGEGAQAAAVREGLEGTSLM